MGVVRKIAAVIAVLLAVTSCQSTVTLDSAVPLDAATSYITNECFYEISQPAGRVNLSPPVFKQESHARKGCSDPTERHSDGVLYLPGVRLSPGDTLEFTALDAGQILESRAAKRRSQATIPHQVTLPIRFVNPRSPTAGLSTLEEGILLSALTTRRLRCFSSDGSACARPDHAALVRSFFDGNSLYLWNTLVQTARVIPYPRALYRHTGDQPGHADMRWAIFLSFSEFCRNFATAKGLAADDQMLKTFASFYPNAGGGPNNADVCAGLSNSFFQVPRYLVGGPNAFILSAITSGEIEGIDDREGFYGNTVMARYSSVTLVSGVNLPKTPVAEADAWTLADWEDSGICDIPGPDNQHRYFGIRAIKPHGSVHAFFLPHPDSPVNNDGNEIAYKVYDRIDDSGDAAPTRTRELKLDVGSSPLSLRQSLSRSALKQLYLSDLAAITWQEVKASDGGSWKRIPVGPPPGCNFGKTRGGSR